MMAQLISAANPEQASGRINHVARNARARLERKQQQQEQQQQQR
jgi:hypothetical protein